MRTRQYRFYMPLGSCALINCDDLLISAVDTDEKPFPCPYCSLRFRRTDVRSRHIHNSHSEEDVPSSDAFQSLSRRKNRARVACSECRRRKIRCRCNREQSSARSEQAEPASLVEAGDIQVRATLMSLT